MGMPTPREVPDGASHRRMRCYGRAMFRVWTSLVVLAATGTTASASPEQLLEELVNVASETHDVAGVERAQDIVARELSALGFTVKRLINPLGEAKSGPLVVATRAGKSANYVTLLFHVDTVFGKPSGFTRYQAAKDGLSATGPGVIDDKGGAVVALEGLRRYLQASAAQGYSLRVISTPSEETGSAGFIDQFRAWSADSVLVLGFEPALDRGIIDSRKGDRWYNVRVVGREAHAGRAHRHGVNACVDLARKLGKLAALTDYRRGSTVNIGSIQGGNGGHSTVCGEASARIDLRFADGPSRAALIAKVETILKTAEVAAADDGVRTNTEFEVVDDPMPFRTNSTAARFVRAYRALIASIEGRAVSAGMSGGTADTNFFAREGLPILDGLGPVGSGMHTTNESIELRTLDTRAAALAQFLASLDRQPL